MFVYCAITTAHPKCTCFTSHWTRTARLCSMLAPSNKTTFDIIKMEDNNKELDADSSNTKKSKLNFPKAEFVEDVDAFMAEMGNDGSVDKVLKSMELTHSKYKFMGFNLKNKLKRLEEQVPDLERSLEIIEKLRAERDNKRELETRFLLSELVFAKAIIPPTDKVGLWLGANVMLEYTLDEAQEFLVKNIEDVKKSMQDIEADIIFLRDQFTTTEVNMARIYNWDVNRRAAAKAT